MEKSLYFELTERYFPNLVTEVVERINAKRNGLPPYMFQQYLTPTYSTDGTWASILADYYRVAADVVALDSELPLKSLDKIATKTGKIPKLGMKLYLTEKQMKDVDNLRGRINPDVDTIVANIFTNLPRCVAGVYERLEDAFLSGLSTGVALSERNEGTGARVDYGYYTENQFGVSTVWSNVAADALADIQKVFDKALKDQNVITDMWLDDTALSYLYNNTAFKQLFAFQQGFVGSNIPMLDLTQVQSVFARRYGVTVHRVARSIRTEINGKAQDHKPWADGRIVFTCNQVLGDLVWTDVAEVSHPVPQVLYQTASDYILLSQYSLNDPLREFTSSQAMAVPIINNVDQIYTLDPKTVQA